MVLFFPSLSARVCTVYTPIYILCWQNTGVAFQSFTDVLNSHLAKTQSPELVHPRNVMGLDRDPAEWKKIALWL